MANVTKDGIEVKAGQVWRDLDKRMPGHTVTVREVSGGFVFAANSRGRLTRISIRRMHKHSTGWELVGDHG